MSKRKLLVTVDCEKTTCGKCRWWLDSLAYCRLYFDDADYKQRCPACLRAEAETRKEGKR